MVGGAAGGHLRCVHGWAVNVIGGPCAEQNPSLIVSVNWRPPSVSAPDPYGTGNHPEKRTVYAPGTSGMKHAGNAMSPAFVPFSIAGRHWPVSRAHRPRAMLLDRSRW